MRIHLCSGKHRLHFMIPTMLVFNPLIAKIAVRHGLPYAGDSRKEISPEAISALFAEFRRIKKKYGSWELVMVESSDGDLVKIIL